MLALDYHTYLRDMLAHLPSPLRRVLAWWSRPDRGVNHSIGTKHHRRRIRTPRLDRRQDRSIQAFRVVMVELQEAVPWCFRPNLAGLDPLSNRCGGRPLMTAGLLGDAPLLIGQETNVLHPVFLDCVEYEGRGKYTPLELFTRPPLSDHYPMPPFMLHIYFHGRTSAALARAPVGTTTTNWPCGKTQQVASRCRSSNVVEDKGHKGLPGYPQSDRRLLPTPVVSLTPGFPRTQSSIDMPRPPSQDLTCMISKFLRQGIRAFMARPSEGPVFNGASPVLASSSAAPSWCLSK